ncbi:hypothetical protein QEN19_003640 [Hanseniaspora menglaensis]
MNHLNKIKAIDLPIYSRLLEYIHPEDDATNVSSTVISSNDKKHLVTNFKSGNIVSQLTTAVISMKDNTTVLNLEKQLYFVNNDILKLKTEEPLDSSSNLMILLKTLPWDDSSLTLMIIEQLFKNIGLITGDFLYFQIFQKLKIKKLGNSNKELKIEEFRDNLQIDSFNLLENLRLLYNIKDKEFWSFSVVLAMKEIGLFETVGQLQTLVYWTNASEGIYIDNLISKVDDRKLSEEELIVYCQVLLLRGLNEDSVKIIQLIEKDIVEKSGTINLYLKNIVIEACQKVASKTKLLDITSNILKGLNDYKVLLAYVDVYISLNENVTKKEIIAMLDEKFSHFLNTRNFKLIKIYLDYKFNDGFEHLAKYLDVFNNKLCCIPDLKNLVPKDILVEGLSKYESSSGRDYNIYQLTQDSNLLSKLEESLDFQESIIVEKLNNVFSLSIREIELLLEQLDSIVEKNLEAFQFKLLKLVLYNYLSFSKQAKEVYHDLNIKNMQKLSLDSLLNDIIPESGPVNDINAVEELNNFAYILSLTLEKKSYSKFVGLVKFELKISNSNVVLFTSLENIKKQRFFGNKQYRSVLNSLASALLKFGIKNTKDTNLVLPYNLINKYDYSDNEQELWLLLLNEFNILKCLEGGTLRYERIIRIITEQKLSKGYESKNEIFKWQFSFFEKYSLISDNNEKIIEFLDKLNIPSLVDLQNPGSSPFEVLGRYITILETLKTLDSIKKFQNNKTLKNKIKPILKQIRDGNVEVIEMYLSYFQNSLDHSIEQYSALNAKLVKSL